MKTTKKFNHAFDFAFEVVSNNEYASDVTSAMIREALLKRAINISDKEMVEAAGHLDTYEEKSLDIQTAL